MKNIGIILSVSILIGCNQLQSNKEPDSKATVYNFNGNKIIFLDAYYTDYLNAAKVDFANRDKYFKENVYTPIYNLYYSKSKYGAYLNSNSFPYHDTTALAANISLLVSNRSKIEELISSALTECNKYLKNDTISICIVPANVDTGKIIQKMGGELGFTLGSKLIKLIIDPRVSTWEDMLKYTVSHEFEHSYWIKMTPPDSLKRILLAYLISEGRADSYAHFIYPDKKCPWTVALSDSGKTALWNRIKPQLNTEDQMFEQKVMFGYSDYPLWGGYTLGYSIVQSALKNNPQLTPVQWANLKPEEILQMSDYK